MDEPPGAGARRALLAIKAVHTLAWFSIESCMAYVLYAGLANRTDRRAAIAGAVVAGESLVFAANGFRCPLTDLAESLGAEHGSVTDIYLPTWFARNLPGNPCPAPRPGPVPARTEPPPAKSWQLMSPAARTAGCGRRASARGSSPGSSSHHAAAWCGGVGGRVRRSRNDPCVLPAWRELVGPARQSPFAEWREFSGVHRAECRSAEVSEDAPVNPVFPGLLGDFQSRVCPPDTAGQKD